MRFRDVSEDFQTGRAILEILDPGTTARNFNKRFIGLFMSRLYSADRFFCGECWSPLLPCGLPRVEVFCLPVRLRVTMTVSCNCVAGDEPANGTNEGDEIPW